MNDNGEFEGDDQELSEQELIEQYLLFLRGRGPEPSLTESPENIRHLFEIVAALADRSSSLPPVEEDPVAVRLGLVEDSASDDGDSGQSILGGSGGLSPVESAMNDLVGRFPNSIDVDLSTLWYTSTSSALLPVGVCRSLGDTVAVCIAPVDEWTTEPDIVAVIFRQHPELSAVALTSATAERAVVLTAAESNRSVDPLRGWLEPGSQSQPEQLGIALERHFERSIPRWELVSGVEDLLDVGDFEGESAAIAANAIGEALASRPRLEYKKAALSSLRHLDADVIASIVVDVQEQRLGKDDLLSRLATVAEAATS